MSFLIYILRDHDFLEVLYFDFVSFPDRFLEQLFESFERTLVKASFRAGVGDIRDAFDDVSC